MYMIKLIDLLREAKGLTDAEQQVIDDLLGTLEEGAFDNLLTKVKNYTKKGLLTATVLTALMAAPELTSAQKKEIQGIAQTSVKAKERTGTAVDGIVGQFTSQFKFPKAFLTIDKTVKDLGVEGNDALNKLSKLGKEKMDQWNTFVDWLDTHQVNGKKLKGNPALDKIEFSTEVIDQYKETHPDFWIKDTNDIKTVQDNIKNYRTYTIAKWKAGDGKDGAIINLGDKHMNPKNPEDVKSVEDRYMKWAKD